MTDSKQPVRIYKFGGASVKDAAGLLNVAEITRKATLEGGRIVLVVSAMGKTTNALEAILASASAGEAYEDKIQALEDVHLQELEAATKSSGTLSELVKAHFDSLRLHAQLAKNQPFDETYDQIVSLGEVLSSQILHGVLQQHIPTAGLLDAKLLIKTNSNFRSPKVDTALTFSLIEEAVGQSAHQVLVVQGFIGSDELGRTTTLGREGSDYTAALFGHALKAQSVTVWKDVLGVLNADPKRLANATLIPRMTYAEAAEMTYYGATVIHPKTLKPLADEHVPLYVRSFVQPEATGTFIGGESDTAEATNVLLYLDKIALLTCQTKDLRFVTELHISKVMRTAFDVGLQVLMVQNSALEMQLVVAQDFQRAGRLAELLVKDYHVSADYNLTLQTYLRAEAAFVAQNLPSRGILLEQRTSSAYRVLIRA